MAGRLPVPGARPLAGRRENDRRAPRMAAAPASPKDACRRVRVAPMTGAIAIGGGRVAERQNSCRDNDAGQTDPPELWEAHAILPHHLSDEERAACDE